MPAEVLTVEVEALLLPLADKFRASLLAMTDQAALAIQGADAPALADAGHSIKGTAAYFGVTVLRDLGAGLEDAARHHDMIAAQVLVDKLRQGIASLNIIPRDPD